MGRTISPNEMNSDNNVEPLYNLYDCIAFLFAFRRELGCYSNEKRTNRRANSFYITMTHKQ